MSATTGVRFTPLAGPAAPANQTILKVAQAEPQLSRTYYQDGRLLTAVDLNRDYTYLDQRLLDLGIALGDGIVQGLAASLPDGVTLTVTQGRGIAPSGRVIAYAAADPTAPLTASLADLATQMTLNGAGFGGIGDGLYGVVLLHTQAPTGIAEVFPRDLSATRITYESIVDNVEIALVGLPQPIPAGTPYQSRANLAAQYASGQNLPVLPSDSLALGVLAMQKGQALWFDPSLLRHPLRAGDAANAAQDDLARTYRRIYADQMAALALGGSTSFRAADVFPILPPTGLLPRASIDPTAATQTFFPDQIDVVLAPARSDEVDALLAQAEGEPNVNLAAAAPAQIMVLVPLAPDAYATLAPALLGPAPSTAVPAFLPYPTITLPRIDPLLLRLPGRAPTPPSQPSAWAQIWAQAPADLAWLVRPSDGGIGGAIAAQLAAGYPIPTPPPPPPPPPPTSSPPPTTTPATTASAPPTSTTPNSSPAPPPTTSSSPPPTTSSSPPPTTSSAPPPTTSPPPTSSPATSQSLPPTSLPTTTHTAVSHTITLHTTPMIKPTLGKPQS